MRRRGASPIQPYRDLLRLVRKESVLAENASWLFRAAPYLVFAAIWVAASLVPTFAAGLIFNWTADLIAIVALLGSARFFLALAGMDVGTSFGGIGSSREMMIASLAEPAMLMIVFSVSLLAHSTQLSTVVGVLQGPDIGLRVTLGMALVALVIVAIAENGRIPVDNPATHLELTMVHEAMVLEYSGRHLALIEAASALEAAAYMCRCLAPCSCPSASPAPPTGPAGYATALGLYLGKLLLGGVASGRVRDRHRQDARLPRAGVPGRGPDAGAARPHAALREPESCKGMARGFAFDLAHLLSGGMVLMSFMLLYQEQAQQPAARLRAPRPAAVAGRGLAGPRPGRAASLHHRGDRAGVQGHRHPGRAAIASSAAWASTASSRPWSASARPCCSAWGWWHCPSPSCCRSPAKPTPLAREDLAFALSVVLLGLLGDDHPAQRGSARS